MRELQEHYDRTAAHWVKTHPRRAVLRQADALLRHLPASRDVAIDLGCGGGVYSRPLRSLFKTVVGFDFSHGMLSAARASSPGIGFCRSDARALPLTDRSVDFVASCGLAEHVGDMSAVLAEIRRVLRPSGTVAIAFANAHSLWKGVGASSYPGGLVCHDSAQIADTARDAGLKPAGVRYLHAAGPLTSRLPPAVDRLERVAWLCQRFVMVFDRA